MWSVPPLPQRGQKPQPLVGTMIQEPCGASDEQSHTHMQIYEDRRLPPISVCQFPGERSICAEWERKDPMPKNSPSTSEGEWIGLNRAAGHVSGTVGDVH